MEHRICLAFDGTEEIEISCRPNEDVVSAALRQGVLIVSDCRRGICGACRASLVDGHYDELLPHNVHALSDEEEENGWVLSCRLRPRSDLRLEFDYSSDRVVRLGIARRAARALRSEQLHHGLVRLLAKTASFQAPLEWTAGQHVIIGRARDSVGYRAFPTGSDSSGFEVEFFLMPPHRTAGEPALFSQGEALTVEGPFGDFGLLPGTADLLFIAGPQGLPAAAALIRALPGQERGEHTTLFFDGTRAAESSLRILVGKSPILAFGLGALSERLRLPHPAQLYLCGPPAFNAAARSIVASVRAPKIIISEIDSHEMHFERTTRA